MSAHTIDIRHYGGTDRDKARAANYCLRHEIVDALEWTADTCRFRRAHSGEWVEVPARSIVEIGGIVF